MIVGTQGIPKSVVHLDPHHHHHPGDGNGNGNGNASVSRLKTLKTNFSISCCSKKHDYNNNNNNNNNIPKLEPFSKSKFERGIRDPPLIEKSQNQLADYCTLLEGESSYSCWQAYFELKEMQKEYPKEQVEKLIIEAGGVKSLIGCLHGVAAIHKANNNKSASSSSSSSSSSHSQQHKQEPQSKEGHIPDGLPKTTKEVEEEENAKMPDSAYTRLLRLRGTLPAWYSPAPN